MSSTAVTATVAPRTASRRARVRDALASKPTEVAFIVAFMIGHIPLAVLMREMPVIATFHALACLALGVAYAATTQRIRNVAVIVAYIVGCEVLWRMTKADIFWEFGKYAIVAVLGIALFRIRWPRNRVLASLYLLLLLPSTALTFASLDFDQARQDVSFYLSGPLAVTMCVLFFSNIRLAANQLLAVLFAVIGPVVGILALSYFSTRAESDLEFVNAANAATSGGFGPNQVSAMLGLAVMFLLLMVVLRQMTWRMRVPMFILAAGLATQSALTFSRGGVLLSLAGVAAATFFILRGNRRGRVTVVIVGLVAFLIGNYVIEPRLDAFTNGELHARYSNTSSSGRDIFINSELRLFNEHPLFGVGPGAGLRIRAERGVFYGASHTEYSRTLAEHGLFGLLALCCLFVLCIRAIQGARDTEARAFASAMIVWFTLFLLVYGTRIAAPAFVFGLAFVRRAPSRTGRVAAGPSA